MLQSSDINLLNGLISEVKKDLDIVALILYGSSVRENEYNDIDICLVPFLHVKDIPFQKILYYKGNFPSKLDIQFFTDLPLYIQHEVLNHGKLMVNKDFEQVCDIYEKTYRAFNDFYPHFKLFLEVD
ncbi:hypothetical protein [Candidatus Harpocratesius sp.]